ncbi:swr1 complex component [Emydomyces testavorans]|uniref:DNA helicase n=1 Tax=Emydomyces testavorans TaxID=2070801 RepID=A0AAF0DJM1_9EURO|nr:swr1 complex component [Emydomyces testavorans]
MKLDTDGDVTSDQLAGPPSKRRKLADSSSRSTPRPSSPPWKKAGIDGPTSFLDGGRRRSTRTNIPPVERPPQSEKRYTRSAQKDGINNSVSSHPGWHELSSPLPTPSRCDTRRGSARNTSVNGFDGASGRKDSTRALGVKTTQAKQPMTRADTRKVSETGTRSTSKFVSTSVNGHSGNGPNQGDNMAVAQNWRSGADSRHVEAGKGQTENLEKSPMKKTPRIRFKVKMPSLAPQNPSHLVPPKKYSSFREWVHNEVHSEDDPKFLTSESALQEYQTWSRLWDEAGSGGLLSKEKCSVYLEDPEEEPPQKYTHHDHFVAHAVYFKKLLDKEHRQHRHTAKLFAHWCADAWKKRNKRPEDILKEQQEEVRQKHRALVKDLQRQFEQVRTEVEKVRLARWEEEQRLEEQLALNKALKQSTMLWEKRVGDKDKSGFSEIDEVSESEDMEEGDASDEESSDAGNMSSNSSDSDSEGAVVDDDADLSPEALRKKYAHLATANIAFEGEAGQINGGIASILPVSPEARDGQTEQTHSNDLDMEFDGTLDEVDSVLLDDSDGYMDTDETEESEDGKEDEDAEVSDDNSESDPGLLGFFSAKDLDLEMENEAEDQLAPADPEAIGDYTDEESSENGDDDEADAVHFVPVGPQLHNKMTDSATLIRADPPTPSATIQIGDEKSNTGSPRQENSPQDHLMAISATHPVNSSNNQECSSEPQDAAPVDDHRSPVSPTSLHPADENGTCKDQAELEPLLDHLDSPHEEQEDPPEIPVENIVSQETPTIKTPIPHLLRGTLREYQHFGLDWLAGLYASNINGILADEMGLGKTIQTIALLAHLAVEHEVWGPHLIVVPTSVMLNWEMEFKKWCPGFKILTYYGTQEERRQKRRGWMDDDRWHVCITSYQLVLQDQQTFKRRNWHYMVLDEAHNIKNFRSQRWQTLLTFKTRARLLLTGTPLQNNLTELWSLLFFLMPNDDSASGLEGFADLRNFSEWFRRPVEQILEHGRDTMDDEARKVVSKLHTVLRPYILRRLKVDVEKQMPAKYEHVITCRLSQRQRFLYDGFMSRAQTKETLASGNYLSIINCLMQLRKVCNHPDLFETRPITTSFTMSSSTIADLEVKDLLIRRRLLYENPLANLDMDFLSLVPISREDTSKRLVDDATRIMAYNPLRMLRERQYNRTNWNMIFDGSSIRSVLECMENSARKTRMGELERCLYFESKRHGRRPIYGESLIDFLKIDMNLKPTAQRRPPRRMLIDWLSRQSSVLETIILSLDERACTAQPLVQKFACITPAVVSPAVTAAALTPIKSHYFSHSQRVPTYDPFHEAQMRLSIAFPDKRLLQYDCGKLQQLDKLLRQLQAGGHRALIFTQMTKMLDILEQFLNVHGHRYLRLDGATKIEQRQMLTERFNSDPRILVFILSSRSGGLGINLTGADTVIFYDLDWNPAMDKQCQDRCHRIGQTRDVHIYRLVSEYTIESNILRKANQKRMLDDVVIQEGEFTTDYFQKLNVRDMLGEDISDGQDEASAAMDMVLDSKVRGTSSKVFDEAEDKEDLDAAKTAEKELEHVDDGDFAEGSLPQTPGQTGQSQVGTPASSEFVEDEQSTISVTEAPGTPEAPAPTSHAATGNAPDENVLIINHIDDYLLRFMEWNLQDEPLALPPDKSKKRSKRGKEHRVKRHR